MKKHILLSVFTVFIFLASFARQITVEQAMRAGAAFLQQQATGATISELSLVYSASGKKFGITDASATHYFFIFNYKQGFVIVSADDCAIPVLGYSTENIFDAADIPVNMQKWLEVYKTEIRRGIELNVRNEETIGLWDALLNSKRTGQKKSSTTVVAPLIQTKWNQSPFYNDYCPFDATWNEKTVTGCVATAMAQVAKYWNYPSKGKGYHVYKHPVYGNISANFGATAYNWAAMPNIVDTTNHAVAELMYQMGVSVDMSYGVGSKGGSNAYMISAKSPIQHCSEYALKTYFGYSDNMVGIEKANFPTQQWISILKNEFNAGRPVLYAGFGYGGHCFIADGYDCNDFIHFNWGWGGKGPDGYYSVHAVVPADLGTGGGGGGGFTSGQQAIIGIQPPAMFPDYAMQLGSAVQLTNDTVYYTQPLTLTATVANSGNGVFAGELNAIVFDEYNNMIAFIETKPAQTISAGATVNLSFSTSGLAEVLPGNYTAGIFYRANGEALWNPVADFNNFHNFDSLLVYYENDIELYSDIQALHEPLIKDSVATVFANFKNNSPATYTGNFYTGLFTADGNFVQMVDSVAETSGLSVGGSYNNPLTFSSPVSTEPGSYLLAALHEPAGGNLQLSGSSYYQNPRRIIVREPDLTPDIYEVNNMPADAYNLPVSFTGDSAFVYTPGSNIHVGNDVDHYKIDLPPGYSYTVKPRVYDAQHPFNGTAFTVDISFNFSADGISYTEFFDDNLPFTVDYANGGSLYVGLAPYFFGATGTYLLELKIERQTTLPVSFLSFNAVKKAASSVALDWQVQNNNRNAFFEVERSSDGKTFSTIAMIKNQMPLKHAFHHMDENAANGKNFYRIKQVDPDGKMVLSDVRMVDCSETLDFVAGPNPAANSFTVRFKAMQPRYTISMINADGKLVRYINGIYSTVQTIDTNDLPNGTYFLDVQYGTDSKQIKMVIKK